MKVTPKWRARIFAGFAGFLGGGAFGAAVFAGAGCLATNFGFWSACFGLLTFVMSALYTTVLPDTTVYRSWLV